MKAAETKTTTAAQHLQAKGEAQQPFFQKEGGEGVLSNRQHTLFPAAGSTDGDGTQPFFNKSVIRPKIQTKLTIGQPGDKYEQEADSMADQVVQKLADNSRQTTIGSEQLTENNQPQISKYPNIPISNIQRKPIFESNAEPDVQTKLIASSKPQATSLIQTKCAECEQKEKLQQKEELGTEEEPLQMKPIFGSNAEPPASSLGGLEGAIQRQCSVCGKEETIQKKENGESSATSNLESQLNTSKGSGSPLPNATRTSMEGAFGTDFSNVRVHTNSAAVQMNQDLGAQAFTHGSDVYFNAGKYNPGSTDGQKLLAHELTHTVQQGAIIQTKAEKANSTQLGFPVVGNFMVQANFFDDALNFGSNVVSSVTSGVSSAVDAAVGGAQSIGEGVSEFTQEGIRQILDRFAPGLWNLLNGGLDEALKERIFASLARVFQQLQQQIESGALAEKIRAFFSRSKEKLREWQQSVDEDCKGFYEQINALVAFLGDITDPIIQNIRDELTVIANLAGPLWEKFGQPAWDAIRELAGDAWEWLQSTAQWIWQQTAPIRETLTTAWEWIKRQLGILQDSAESIWDRLKDIATQVWDEIRQFIAPILGPLRSIGEILLMFSPLGPIMLIYQGATAMWDAIRWIATNWSGWQTLIRLKEFFAETILPAIMKGVAQVRAFIGEAVTWVNGIITQLRTVIIQFLDSIGVLQAIEAIQGFISQVRTVFNEIKSKFDSFIESLENDFNSVIEAARVLLNTIWECLRPVLDFVLGLIFIVINPSLWPVYAVNLTARLVWAIIPEGLRIAAIDYIIDLLIGAVDYLRPSLVPEPIWLIFRSGALTFLERIRAYSPDEKMRFVEKLLNIAIDPRYFGGFVRGIIAGFVQQAWDLISGVFSLVTGIPEIITGVVNFFRNLVPDLAFLEQIQERFEALIAQLQEFMNIDVLIEEITNFVQNAPEALANWIEETTATGVDMAQRMGREFAETLFNTVLNLSSSNAGYYLGNIAGRILFEVLLTKGVGFLAGRITSGLNWLRRGLNALRSRATRAARGLFIQAKRIFNRVLRSMRSFFRRLGARFERLFDRVKQLIDDFIAWIMRAIRGNADEFAQWLAFIAEVRAATTPTNTGFEGVTRERAYDIYNPILSANSRVAGAPRGLSRRRAMIQSEENSGYWKLVARKKFGVFDRVAGEEVGRLLIKRVIAGPRDGRWERGKHAVRERIRRGFSTSELNTRSLTRILEPIKENFRYRRLEAVRDEQENDWNIIASMSPAQVIGKVNNHRSPTINQHINKAIIQKTDTTDEEIGEVNEHSGLHRGTPTDPIPIHWYKHPNFYPNQISLLIDGSYKPISMYSSRRIRRRRGNRELVTIGVSASNRISRGRRLLKQTIHTRTGVPQRHFREILEDRGGARYIRGRDADHVLDLQFGGEDSLRNIWPLDSDVNRRPVGFGWGGDDWLQSYLIRYIDSTNQQQTRPLREMNGYWFRIIGFRYPPTPNPGGMD